jgi:hypothetical protein
MPGLSERTEEHRITLPRRPIEIINLFMVHEVLLVKEPHVVHHPPVDEQDAPWK